MAFTAAAADADDVCVLLPQLDSSSVRNAPGDDGTHALVAGRFSALAYVVLSIGLIAYVALCAPNRDVRPDADAWEHHRALGALVADLTHPGNPTFAVDAPSIRYSPYFLVQAVLCRTLHVDAYAMLGYAAVLNTMLLCGGLWSLMRAWGESAAAPLGLVCLIGLWGVAPGYAGSTALADLPWHQVNPSAFSFATCLFALASLKRWTDVGRAWRWAVIGIVCVVAMIDHGMTGAFALLALLVVACVSTSARRNAAIACVLLLGAVTLGACLLWPWYPFLQAVRSRLDTAYWFNGAIVRLMIFQWCAPAILLSLATLARFDRSLVRAAFAIGTAGLAMTLASVPVASPTFARFLMPATVFFQIGIAVWAYHSGVLRAATWANVFRTLRNRSDADRVASAVLMVLFVAALAYGLVPQFFQVVREPYLARPLLVRLAHKPDKGTHLKPLYDTLLADVGPRDVVLADTLTAWPIPSSRGRIVSALHYERFVVDQPQRDADVERFFAADATDAERAATIAQYGVRWIVVNLAVQPERAAARLLATHVERRRAGALVLLDAR